jgi:hypothetical protein
MMLEHVAIWKLLIDRKRRSTRTTRSNHWFSQYPNLIKETEIVRSNIIPTGAYNTAARLRITVRGQAIQLLGKDHPRF